MIGRRVSHYDIVDRLGAGETGEMYRARDLDRGREVALKVLPTEVMTDAVRLELLRRAIESLNALDHPNIVTPGPIETAKADEEETVDFITMELVEGSSLELWIPKGGLSPDRLPDIGLPLTDALASAHETGISHRHLNPSTIMITEDHQVKVLGFGIVPLRKGGSAQVEASDRSSGWTGLEDPAVLYLSPEQLQGKPADQRSDVFSLGVILYELATGRRPVIHRESFSPPTPAIDDESSPVSDLATPLPERLQEILLRCLEKDPRKRYRSARELHRELQTARRAIVGTRTTAGETAAGEASGESWRAGRSLLRWWPAGLAAIAILLAAGLWLRPGRGPVTESVQTVGLQPSRADAPVLVAVLPFENLGRPEDAYLASGLGAELRRHLAEMRGVAPLSSIGIASSEGTGQTTQEIGIDLGAHWILSGTVVAEEAPDGSRILQITPALLPATEGLSAWRATWDAKPEEIASLPSEMAAEIGRQLNSNLADLNSGTASSPPPRSASAYESYLRGLDHMNRSDRPHEDLVRARELFEKSVELDPDSAAAWDQLSVVHLLLSPGGPKSDEQLERARAAATKALELDPDSAWALLALGQYHSRRGEFDRADEALSQATERLPFDPEALRAMAGIRRHRGHFEEALELLQAARRYDPLGVGLALEQADTLRYLRRFREVDDVLRGAAAAGHLPERAHLLLAENHLAWNGGTARAQAALEAMAQSEEPALLLARVHLEILTRDYEAALRRLSAIQSWFSTADRRYVPKTLVEGWILELMGRTDAARSAYKAARVELEELVEKQPQNPQIRSGLGWTYAALGLKGAAIREGRLGVELLPITSDHILGARQVEALARVYAIVGEADAAIDELSLLLTVPSELSVQLLRLDPTWDSLRHRPRFQQLLDRSG
jgi:tetratricopeptide (TPR) repeat protein